jgi:hypothetical protein
MAQKDLKSRIASVKNIQKITRAMEMVAAGGGGGVAGGVGGGCAPI